MNLRRLFTRQSREQELEEELQAHLAMATRDRIEQGEDPHSAALAARKEFGNRTLIHETTRDMWGWSFLDQLRQDARYAMRGLRRSPGFTSVALLSLALGIGANTAIFSLVETVMLRLLPVQHPEQLVELLQKYPGEPRGNGYWTQTSYQHFRDHNHVFSALIGTSFDNRACLAVAGQDPERGISEYVLPNYFSELGLTPALGRLISPNDQAVAVISWSWWTNHLHQEPGILGQRIRVEDTPVTIIGVAPRQFTGLRAELKTDVWLPQPPDSRSGLALVARLKPGVTIEQARAEMSILYRFTIEERAAKSQDPLVHQLNIDLEPAATGLSTIRDRYGKPLTLLMAVAGLLLLLACLNLAGLLLARGAARQREMALRTSLGAGRGRLVRQIFTESLILSTGGTLLGLVLAWFGTATLVRILASGREHEQIHLQVQPDLQMILFTTGIALLAGILFGLAPALHTFLSPPVPALKQSGSANETRPARFFGKCLVAAQVALSVLLLSCAGLFVANLVSLQRTDLGFQRDHVLLVTLDHTRAGYSPQGLSRAYGELLDRLPKIPGVRSVSLGGPTPLQGAGASGYATVEGFTERPEDRRRVSISWIAPGYFQTLGTTLLSGRDFRFGDQERPRLALINRTWAQYYFPGRNPIGQHVTLDHVTMDREPKTYEIIGVVADAHYFEIRETVQRAIYLPAFHDGQVTAGSLIIRTSITPDSIGNDVTRVVRSSAPGVTVARLITLSDQINASIVPERLIATLSGYFGVLGTLLAGIGLFGLLAYTVARRTNEIGIRMALGATAANVSWMVLGDALVMVIAGTAAGIPLALWGRALTATLISDRAEQAAAPLALGAIIILAVGFLASFVPARRASRVDPMTALRHE